MANTPVRQYIGARYVPLFANPAEWDNKRTYEPLTIVIHQGNSYTSRQYVPTGIDITNNEYWALTGNYNAQIESYRKETQAATTLAQNNKQNINNINASLNALDVETPEKANNKKNKWDASSTNRVFNTVQDMKADTLLANGMTCQTLGFYRIGDGGGASYQITNTDTPNEMDIIACKNNLNAKIVQNNNMYNARQYGAHGDGETDDTNILIYLTKKQRSIIYIPSGQYICKQTIKIGYNTAIIGDNVTNTSPNDMSTCILSYDLPKTTEQQTPAISLTSFNTVKNLSIKGNQWQVTENRQNIQPRTSNFGNWMTHTATNENLQTVGIYSDTVNLIQNVYITNFYTGYILNSQGYAETLNAKHCIQAYELSGDFRLDNALAQTCIRGFFFKGGNVEVANLRCDGIYDYAYQMYYGGTFNNLSADFIGNSMIRLIEFEGTIDNIRVDRCCVNYSSTTNEATNTQESFGIVLINPINAFINTALIFESKSIADNSTDTFAKYKTIGQGMIIVVNDNATHDGNFTAYIESTAIPVTKQSQYTSDEKNKLFYIDTSSHTNRMYGYIHFRNTTFTLTAGAVSEK